MILDLQLMRGAIAGFTRLALRAGTQTATNATTLSSIGIPMKTIGSSALTPTH
jgi:hypothetical protein